MEKATAAAEHIDRATATEGGNSDSASNYVDRVRIRDSSNSFGGPGRGSGWRQKSLSNIDLPTSYRGIAGGGIAGGGLGAGQFRYRDYDSGLYDLYSRIDSRREEYEDLYGVNPKAARANSGGGGSGKHQKKHHHRSQEVIAYDHHQPDHAGGGHHPHPVSQSQQQAQFYNPDSNEACSLRRTRSLAVIREESYNDLHLPGRGSRRSQLIPRAKLVDRNFFKERFNFIYDDTGELSETPNDESHYTLARRFSSQAQPFPWHTDKSDLDSIDSSIFKHSLHQQSSFDGSRGNSIRSDSTKFVSKVEVHSEYSGISKSDTGVEADLKHLDDLSLKEDGRTVSKTSTLETIKKRYPIESKFTVKEEDESGITIIEIKDSHVSQKSSSVISYDSIYLSSESDDKEILDELLPDVRLTEEDADFIDLKYEDYDNLFHEADLEKAESTIDTLYGQVTKPKPKIVAVEPKIQPNDSLRRYVKNTSRSTIERLSIISNLKLRQEFSDTNQSRAAAKEKALPDSDYQYNSLPDADVCKILRNSERIDAKLRRICDHNGEDGQQQRQQEAYDSLPRLNKANLQNLTRSPSDDDTSLEESDKGAPSIEVVETPTKEVLNPTPTKVYLKELGVELDYENSVITNSDQDSDITIVAPEEEQSTHAPVIVVTPVGETTKSEPVVYSTFASTAGKHSTSRINFESKEKPKSEALQEVRTKLKPIPVIVEQTKIPLALAPTVKLGGKKVIVDEVAAKAVKREKELEKNNQLNEKKRVQNVESSSIVVPTGKPPHKQTSDPSKHKEEPTSILKQDPIPIVNSKPPDRDRTEPTEGSPKVDHSSLFKDTNPFKEQARREVKNKVIDRPFFKGVRRFNSTENIYTSTPIIVTKTFNNCIKTNEVKTKSFDSLIVENSHSESKMPRPQVIQIVDSKQTSAPGNITDADTMRKTSKNGQLTQKEFLHKVDSVRNYWSKMLDEVDQLDDDESVKPEEIMSTVSKNDRAPPQQQSAPENGNGEERKSSIGSISSGGSSTDTALQNGAKLASLKATNGGQRMNTSRNKYSTYQIEDEDQVDFQSFSPTVEIIELDGQKQAALVKPKNAEALDFDHVRYKVMKSEMFQKNLLVNHRKAAQFDGLMQYLQDYSFQELLAHNNVVIIEPVRTKIEKISEKPQQTVTGVCKITNGALTAYGSKRSSSGLKKHFFYHPIRVNKELLDEELPSPDTVRNVRKLFEGTLRLGTAAKQAYEEAKVNGAAAIRKWDSASLSSGVSSGDLSSPCECGENEHGDAGTVVSSEENLCTVDQELESHYVSQDVLEKIRECGSSVTYYGGRVVDKRAAHTNTMTRAIMKEIHGQDRKCGVCQPHACYQDASTDASYGRSADGGLGVKFKLVKSNSCSSRLELAGTGKTPPDLLKGCSRQRVIMYDDTLNADYMLEEPEETVRDRVSRLESNSSTAVTQPSRPRIIEAKCIEKPEPAAVITINNQSTIEASKASEPAEPTAVTVNNHINYNVPPVPGPLVIPPLLKGQRVAGDPSSTIDRPPKVCRNKNVDLAFAATMTKTTNNKPAKEKENLARKSSLAMVAPGPGDAQDLTASTPEAPLSAASVTKTVTFNFEVGAPVGRKEMPPTATPLIEELLHQQQHHQGPTGDENNNEDQQQQQQQQHAIDQRENLRPSAIAEQRKYDELTSPKLVNWSTVGKFDERQYFANDRKLIEKRKYDDMEFEEFEVLDPNAPGEHYDSLNSK